MKTSQLTSRLYFRDGHIIEGEMGMIYQLWLATPGTAIRAGNDRRPVQQWDYDAR